MTKDETLKIMFMLSAYYGEGKSDARIMAQAWHLILQKYDYGIAQRAVLNFAENDTREYASFPTVGTIVGEIKHQQSLCNGIFNSLYDRVSYEHLSEEKQKLISKSRYDTLLELDYDGIIANKSKIKQEILSNQIKPLEITEG